jgi:hypothetical protein
MEGGNELKIISKETGISILKILINRLVPFGNEFNELFFELRGRIQQERLNKFVLSFKEYFEEKGPINEKNMLTEKFVDLFELVINNVIRTSSEEKIKQFCNILINQINNPETNTEDSAIYIDLISTLSEKEINILFYHKYFDEEYSDLYSKIGVIKKNRGELEGQLRKEESLNHQGLANNSSKIRNEISSLENSIAAFEMKQGELFQFNNSEFYKIDETKYLFYKQRLFAKGLLVELSAGTMDYTPFYQMQITEFGKEFLNFMMEKPLESNPAEDI